MGKPLLYDVFSGAGGAAKGYMNAGFRVIGIDNKPQPRYCGDGFMQMDAFAFFARYMKGDFEEAAAFHSSPPCQSYSTAIRHLAKEVPRLIEPVRNMLIALGKSYVIENVPGAPLPPQDRLDGTRGVLLCGTAFGLNVRRHRLFETTVSIARLPCNHRLRILNPYRTQSRHRDGIEKGTMNHYATAMGIQWMVGDEIGEAIPPIYTEYIGKHLMAYLKEAPHERNE